MLIIETPRQVVLIEHSQQHRLGDAFSLPGHLRLQQVAESSGAWIRQILMQLKEVGEPFIHHVTVFWLVNAVGCEAQQRRTDLN